MVEAEDLISHLSAGLAPADRAAFRRAAESALATSPECSGEGSTYRGIAQLWRSYSRPPRDTRESGWFETRQRPGSKLIAEGQRRDSRRSRGLRVVG